MIRITTATGRNEITVRVEGQVVREYVEAIETAVKQACVRGRPVHLFLRDVSSIDESGHALLSRMAAMGVRLSATGVYSSYIVEEIRRSVAKPTAA
jgi:hypothetical protein